MKRKRLEIKTYVPRTNDVKAVLVSEESLEDVMEWCDGFFPHQMHWPCGMSYNREHELATGEKIDPPCPLFALRQLGGIRWVYDGDYVVRFHDGQYTVFTQEVFTDRYCES